MVTVVVRLAKSTEPPRPYATTLITTRAAPHPYRAGHMSDYRLRLTIDEARHLFHSMMQDMRRVCADSCTSTLNKFMPDSEAHQRFEDIWPRVEDELRKTYELCRFALDVEDLEDSEDVEVFRGFCEDYDGVDEEG